MTKSHLIRPFFVLLLICATAGVNGASAESAPDWEATTLTGDWDGLRSKLYKKGISLEITHKSDVMAIVSGGIKGGAAWMGNSEASLDVDLEKLAGLDGTTAHFHIHGQHGGKFNRDYVGSFIGVDNIEHSVNTIQFDHAWLEKNFYSNSLSLLAGLYTIDSEFYVTDTTGLFFQPPYGPGNELSQSGQYGPPIFPIGALAIRLKYTSPNKNFYLQGAMSDGVPGDPDNLRGTHIKLGNGDGTLAIVEIGYAPQKTELPSATTLSEDEEEYFNKTAIGFWCYSSRIDDLVDVDSLGKPRLRHSQGIYFLAERTLMTEKNQPSQGLAGFFRLGTASEDIHQSDWTSSLGLRYHGLIPSRDHDIAGIAITVNHTGDKYRRLNNANSNQTTLESTYKAQLNPWFALTPTLQYVHNPNMDKALDNAWIVGTRVELNF